MKEIKKRSWNLFWTLLFGLDLFISTFSIIISVTTDNPDWVLSWWQYIGNVVIIIIAGFYTLTQCTFLFKGEAWVDKKFNELTAYLERKCGETK